MHNNNFVSRLMKTIDVTGLSQKEFAEKINISPAFISKIKKELTRPGYNFLLNIFNSFHININWLLTGEGEMFIEEENKKVILPEDLKEMFELINAIPEIKQTLLAKLTESKAIFNKEIEEYRKKIENPDEDSEMKTAG